MQDWRRLIEELSASFQRNEARLSILHNIDQQVLDLNRSLDDILSSALARIISFAGADLGCFCIQNETEFLVLSSIPTLKFHPIPIDTALAGWLQASSLIADDLQRPHDGLFPVFDAQSKTRILLPVAHNGRTWGLMVLESFKDGGKSLLADPDIHEFLRIVRRQLEIAVQFRTQHRDLEQLSKIQNELFTKELDISESLDSLIKNILFALPALGRLRLPTAPEIQILFYEEDDDYLTIRASSGSEPLNTRLFVNNSISGILIEHPELPYYLCDPRKEVGRYRSYLGKDEQGRRSKEIRAELVVPLRYEGKTIGVINLESEHEGAFQIPHVQAMQGLGEKISPIINALQKRTEKTRIQNRANVYAMKKFLDRFAGIYIHKMRQPIEGLNLKLPLIKEKCERADWKDDEESKEFVTRRLQTCLDTVGEIDQLHQEFSKSLSEYLSFGRHSISDLIQLAINDLNPQKLKNKERIEIVFHPKEHYDVFCSLFLREHIYNLLNNSIWSIRTRIREQPHHKGKIVIQTDVVIDKEARQLNRRCLIRIHDNGMGLDKDLLAKIPEPFTTKRSGTGFGIPAAFQYLRGLGGGLVARSEKGKFFEIDLYLDLYIEELHERFDPLETDEKVELV